MGKDNQFEAVMQQIFVVAVEQFGETLLQLVAVEGAVVLVSGDRDPSYRVV